jgi:hypothetical protein
MSLRDLQVDAVGQLDDVETTLQAIASQPLRVWAVMPVA